MLETITCTEICSSTMCPSKIIQKQCDVAVAVGPKIY